LTTALTMSRQSQEKAVIPMVHGAGGPSAVKPSGGGEKGGSTP
jgi:hypothetical protein